MYRRQDRRHRHDGARCGVRPRRHAHHRHQGREDRRVRDYLIRGLSYVMAISLCHGYHIEGSYRVVHWRANASLLLSYLTIYNITGIILISTLKQQQHKNNNNNNTITGTCSTARRPTSPTAGPATSASCAPRQTPRRAPRVFLSSSSTQARPASPRETLCR